MVAFSQSKHIVHVVCAFVSLLLRKAMSTVIDNEITNEPQIECRETGIFFTIYTKNPFRGNLYVRGQFGIPQCRREFYTNGDPTASFAVPLNECGMTKMRQLQPVGLNFGLTIVVSFHPQFVTKVDRSFNVNCFYAQTAQKLNTEIEVSEITPMPLYDTGVMFPKCDYTIREDNVDGPLARSVNVGDPIVHRWNCETSTNFGMLVKNCVVSDGGSSNNYVIDERGCPTATSVIQEPLVYDSSLSLAYARVLAFSFPDRLLLNFQCQIEYCNKADGECMGVSPPNCPKINPDSYVPESIIDPSVNPTRVIGTFTPPFGGPGSSPFPTFPGVPFPTPTNVVGGRFSLDDPRSSIGRPYAANRRHPTSVNNGTQNRMSDQSAPRREQITVFDKHRPSVFKEVPQGAAHTERRTRHTDAQTIDIAAEPVQIVEEFESSGDGHRRRRIDVASTTRQFCTNRAGLATIIGVLMFLSCFIVALSAYIFNDLVIRRNKCRKGIITSRYSSAFVSQPRESGMGAGHNTNAFSFGRLSSQRE